MLPAGSAVLSFRTDENRIVIAHRIDLPLPAASLVKLLIASAVATAVLKRRLSLSESIRPKTEILSKASSELWGKHNHDARPLTDYLRAMLSDSDNFAANVLIDRIGIPTINAHATNLGLQVTRIHGYFIDTKARMKPRSFTTAREMLNLLLALLRGLSDQTSGGDAPYTNIFEALSAQEDRRMIPQAVGNDVPVANKTGEVSGVLNDAAIIGNPNQHPICEIVLTDGNPPLLNAPDYLAAIDHIRTVSKLTYLATR